MTIPSITGSIIQIQSDLTSSSQSVAIPSDAELCLFMSAYWIAGGGLLSSASLDGNAFTSVISSNLSSAENATIWRYVVPSGLRGTSKTLAWAWAADLNEGANIFIVFLKDVNTAGNPIRDSKANASGGVGTSTTGAITTSTDDLLLCVVASYSSTDADAAPSGSGQTEVADSVEFHDDQGAIGTKNGVAGTTTMSGSGADRAVCAVSVIGVSGGVTVTPTAASAKGASVNPTVVLGSILITPASAAARAVVSGPVVLGGGLIITPAAAVARAVAVNPTVIGGGAINPLGEGDSPGFIAFMISNSFYQNLMAAGLGAGLNEPDADNSAEWETFLFG